MKILPLYLSIFLLGSLTAFAQHQNDKKYFLLIGTYTSEGKSEGIYVYDYNSATGNATYKTKAVIQNPSYLTLSKDFKKVFSVGEMGKGKGSISAFNFNSQSGELTYINSVSSGGNGPCYVSVTDNGDYVFSANYGGGSLGAIHVNENGSLDSNIQSIQHEGSSVHKDQKKPHVHSAILSPDNKYVIAADLGTDKIHIYSLQSGRDKPLVAANQPFVKTKPGSGPRHLAFHPSGKYLYSVNELDGTVSAFTYNDGNLKDLQTITMLPAGFNGTIEAADIHLSADGRYLYATNREDLKEMLVYAVQKNGKLKFVQRQSVLGKAPRNFAIDPTGNFVLVANQNTDEIVVFRRNSKNGKLSFTGTKIPVSRPVCLKFAPVGN